MKQQTVEQAADELFEPVPACGMGLAEGVARTLPFFGDLGRTIKESNQRKQLNSLGYWAGKVWGSATLIGVYASLAYMAAYTACDLLL